jgi:hypothetical protein
MSITEQNSFQTNKITSLLARATDGASYNAHKYSLDSEERPQYSLDSEERREIIWKKSAETNLYKTYIPIQKPQDNESIFSYFLDGSRRVFKVDDIAYKESGGRSSLYPIVAGQVGVGCCVRKEKILKPAKFKKEIVLSIPDKADADGKSGFFFALTKKLNDIEKLKQLGIELSAILPYKTAKNDDTKFLDRGTARIQDRMIDKEKELVNELVKEGKLNQDNYLIKDGSLEYNISNELRNDKKEYLKFKNNYNWVLGVSKSFNPEVCLDINGKTNPGFIADLPLYHRTPVACYDNSYSGDIQFAVWYVRLRDKKQTRTPFDGILKIEKILVTDNEIEKGIESELVNFLSANIINERNPTCYGTDNRWANHIYPMYLTESFVKSKYINTETFLELF